ncbi:MAG: DUF1292 domain-containing protein [Peptoniphilaceae bacterium]|uniref:DUF1292 domain-containing protein n=1 Tax=Parvimonas sp. TaxID=1944660 RepID=UPI0025E2C0E6|nr:DUF1292 domain-containing protein [Parvimonas sp.]MCI5997634.1 DUF1292 domain-containing protein [Parvimonas sp.]MDD7765326.1 DUF1292 domain-containing protein [Peptoniphilaceae bacterium]MDY3051245.1 DUF1292 domain-containing protein [Parvimonas sp.]
MERFEAIDENGKKIFFELVDTFGMNESEYAVLNSKDDINTYILKIIYDKQGNMTLEGIDDEELQDAIEVYEELKEERKDYGFERDEKTISG